MLIASGLAAAATIPIAALAFKGRPRGQLGPLYDAVKITTSGDTQSPILSPDAKQIAYGVRDCASEGKCRARLVERSPPKVAPIVAPRGDAR